MASGGRRRRPRRRSRAKVRKTKYLSLSRHLTKAVEAQQSLEKAPASESSPPSPSEYTLWEEAAETVVDGGDGGGQEQNQQLEPFPLHNEPSTLFAAAPSLTDILGASAGGGGESSTTASPDVSSGTGFPGEQDDLARRALRGRERWVYCSSSPSANTTTSSSCSSPVSTGASGGSARSLLLKLDYEEILAAWAGRGSLYIGGAAGLVAPKLELGSVFVEVGPSQHAAAGAWSAPETAGRAEKVRRYKEKRQSRLFAKRIRYDVRRLNAVKRPRLKGRFIKEKASQSRMEANSSLHRAPSIATRMDIRIDPSLCK